MRERRKEQNGAPPQTETTGGVYVYVEGQYVAKKRIRGTDKSPKPRKRGRREK